MHSLERDKNPEISSKITYRYSRQSLFQLQFVILQLLRRAQWLCDTKSPLGTKIRYF